MDPMKPDARGMRNSEWFHMLNQHIISMPDKWEYPWYAAWDLAFHTIALSTVDTDFAKEQLDLMLQESLPPSHRSDPSVRVEFQRRQSARSRLGHHLPVPHGTGPVRQRRHRVSQAVIRQADAEFQLVGEPQRPLLARICLRAGSSGWTTSASSTAAAPLPTGGHLEQADGTAWVSLFCQNMLEIAVELAAHDSTLRRHGT